MNPSVIRSLTRYVAMALADFEVRSAGEEGTFERPFAAVVQATDTRAIALGARAVEVRAGFSVTAYPLPGISREASEWEAHRVQRLLFEAFAVGIDPASFAKGRAHPQRIPLWDYAGVPLFEPAPAAPRIGYLRLVEPPAFTTFPDAGADTFTVACDLRVSWSEGTAIPEAGRLVATVGVSREG